MVLIIGLYISASVLGIPENGKSLHNDFIYDMCPWKFWVNLAKQDNFALFSFFSSFLVFTSPFSLSSSFCLYLSPTLLLSCQRMSDAASLCGICAVGSINPCTEDADRGFVCVYVYREGFCVYTNDRPLTTLSAI